MALLSVAICVVAYVANVIRKRREAAHNTDYERVDSVSSIVDSVTSFGSRVNSVTSLSCNSIHRCSVIYEENDDQLYQYDTVTVI